MGVQTDMSMMTFEVASTVMIIGMVSGLIIGFNLAMILAKR